MADGNQFLASAQAEAAPIERRGPLRPNQLAAARARVSGRHLAHLFMVGDAAGLALAAAAACLLSGSVRGDLLAGAAAALALLMGVGAYNLGPRESAGRHVLSAALAAGMGLAAPLLAKGALGHAAGPLDIAWWMLATAMTASLHLTWVLRVARLRAAGRLTPNIVIVGATPAAERLIRWGLAVPGSINVLGLFDDRRRRVGPNLAGVPLLGGLADLVEHRLLPYVDRVVITVPAHARGRIAQISELLDAIPNPVTLLLEEDDARDQTKSYERVAGLDLQAAQGARSLSGGLLKRAFDIVAASVAAVLLSPAFLLVAAAIKLDSPGPILFRQKRHGYFNEEFVVFKFRSMRADAADAQARRQVTAGDDRVTRVGRFIRKTSLDEIPQLFNVIRGEMSLVGPRPHAIGMLVEGEEATRLLKTYAHRHRLKPGLTGLAAIRGSRGPVATAEDVQRRVALDLEYIERQSFWFDLSIALRTLPCLLGDTGTVR
jgi:exopolysaccharide biosynthesis polyprenyl glycosylphosphotransferase